MAASPADSYGKDMRQGRIKKIVQVTAILFPEKKEGGYVARCAEVPVLKCADCHAAFQEPASSIADCR